MGLTNILILIALFFGIGFLPGKKIRNALLCCLSVFFLFLLQPQVPIRNFDFWFPLLSVALSLLCWVSCAYDPAVPLRSYALDFAVIAGSLLVISLSRLVSFEGIFTATRPPLLTRSLSALLILGLLCAAIARWGAPAKREALTGAIALILMLLVFLKVPALAEIGSAALRSLSGQSADSAGAADLRWLGFSYIAFRLLSVLIERRKARQFAAAPGEFLTYVCFPATLAAGPIDRLDHFQKELRREPEEHAENLSQAAQRIGIGLFKKFILADSLALLALSSQNFDQFRTVGWAWLALAAYSLQIYFDFSGYSDIAIGLSRLVGITLPENFNHPYLKPDIAKFWNNWHITLTQWIRTYVFNPLTRSLRARKDKPLPQWAMILITQMVTMTLIGLWHGGTLNFLLWGVWHGLGLFLHQLYANHTKNWLLALQERQPGLHRAYTVLSCAATFVFVSIGWVWFALPEFSQSLAFLSRLF